MTETTVLDLEKQQPDGFPERKQCATVVLTESIGNRVSSYTEEHALGDGFDLTDALIAATTVEHNPLLATANVKHFRHLSGLKVHVFKP